MEKSVLITGANGFVGRHLLNKLESSDWSVIPLVHRKIGWENEIVLDFCDSNFCETINLLPQVDAVVHLGAKIGWDGSPRKELFVPNVFATGVLANWGNKIGAYFIFASAAIVCGSRNLRITSESKSNPDTDYGYSKWLGEEIIQMSGVKHAILRIAGIFGSGGPSHLGLNKTIDDALHGKIPVQYGTGKIRRNYIYVEDLSDIIIHCIENEVEGKHLVAGSSINTVAEMLQIICDKLLPGSHPEYIEGRKGYDQVLTPSPVLPKGRTFGEAIEHIRERHKL